MSLTAMSLVVPPLLSLLTGQAMAGIADQGSPPWLAAALLGSGALLGLVKLRWGLLGVACGLAFLWGFTAHQRLLRPQFSSEHIHHLAERQETVLMEGRLYREPEGQGARSRWHLAAERSWTPNGAVPAEGNVRVTLRNAYRNWRYGDLVRTPLRLRAPRNRDGSFDYEAFLARRGIYHVAYLHDDREVELVGRGGGWRGRVETMRRRIRRFTERHFRPETGGLVKALTLGDRGGLSAETRSDFAAVGMSHVLSISGLHVGMLSYAVFLLLRGAASRSTWLLLSCPVFKWVAACSLAPVMLYAALAGARVPTVRAAIMIALYHLAVLTGRRASVFGAVAVAAAMAALYWPGAVMEVSFQLSFLAVLSIVGALRLFRRTPLLQPPGPREKGRFPRLKRGVLLSILVPFFATLGTGPLIAHYFGYLSLAGLVANPALVPLVGFVIVPGGLLMGFLSLFFPAGSLLAARVVEPFASLLLGAVKLLADAPLAAVPLPKPGWGAVALTYLVIVFVLWQASRIRPRAA